MIAGVLNDDTKLGVLIFIICFIGGFLLGRSIQADFCHSKLKDGRRFVVIYEGDSKSVAYLLGEKITKPQRKTSWVVGKE